MKIWSKILCLVLCLALLSGCAGGGTSTLITTAPGGITPADPSVPTNPNDPPLPPLPTTPSDPSDPSVPSDPEPSDPTNPTDPTDPIDPPADNPDDPSVDPPDDTPVTPPDTPVTPPDTPVTPPDTPVDPPPANPVTPPSDGIYDIGVDELPYSEEELYRQLFDPNNKIQLDLQMSNSELQKLQDDYNHYRDFGSKSPIYRMGTLKITITTSAGTHTYRINEVGARMKGNTSRTDFYNSNDGIYKYIHLKLDFTETFDDKDYYGSSAKVWTSEEERDARKDRTFAALEQLEMRWNKCYDPTYLRETYAYSLYKSEGVIAPLATICSFGWSGNHMGIYTLVEPVDKLFLEKRFVGDDADGDLYKCGYVTQPANLTNTGSIGIEDEDSGRFYSYDLKNNKKTSTHAALKNLINRLNSSTLTKEEFAKLVDLDQFLSFAAVSYFLGNPDDIRNNSNNYYLYFVPSTGKAVFIPYDFDRCLGLTYEWDPTGNGVTQDDPFTDRMAINDRQRNPVFTKSVVKGGWYVQEYSDRLKEVAANPMMQSATFEQWVNRAKGIYSSHVQPSKEFHNAKGRDFRFSLAENLGGNMSVKTYLTKKLNTYNRAIGNLDDILDYQPTDEPVFYIRGGFNGWQDQPAYAMTVKDGKASIILTISSNNREQRFKVYNSVQQLWYGTESISENTTVSYESAGSNGNILLKAGKYKIELDLTTMLITITPA